MFPARAGMSRLRVRRSLRHRNVPRASGDEPWLRDNVVIPV